jgi:uncharacterized circularly permuted ATP-grasp superfamily protein/uncharacterized alpha-E superfamily protein
VEKAVQAPLQKASSLEEWESRLLDILSSFPSKDLWELLRQAPEDGFSSETFDGPGANRPGYSFDPLPLVLAEEEWELLREAAAQRLKVWNSFLADVYGDGQVLEKGLLPVDCLCRDPNFLRECVSLRVPKGVYVHHLAVDFVQTAEGRWLVLEDKVGVPSGAALALVCRRLSWRVLRQYCLEARAVADLGYPTYLLEALEATSPLFPATTRGALLGAGPDSPWYFEEGLLARHMGIPMVRGEDLVVLDRAVFFKTVAGLQRLDLLYRRIPTALADPVSLEPSSHLGVPGLLSALRAGSVVVANAVGTELAENRLLARHFSGLCRFYLGEEPVLGFPTVWELTDPDTVEWVREHPEEFTLLPAWQSPSSGASGEAEKVAVKHLSLCSRPVWKETGALLRPFRLRVFALLRLGRAEVLPTAVALVPQEGEGLSSLLLAGSWWVKDVWVMGKGASQTVPSQSRPRKKLRYRTRMGSRTAEHLFWMGRYLERSEVLARAYRSLKQAGWEIQQAGGDSEKLLWEAVAVAMGQGSFLMKEAAFANFGGLAFQVLWNKENPASLHFCVESACRNAHQAREAIPPEVWAALGAVWQRLENLQEVFSDDKADLEAGAWQWISGVLGDLDRFWGSFEKHMLHHDGWFFFRLGWYLENALFNSLLLSELESRWKKAVKEKEAWEDEPIWDVVLRLVAARYAHRSVYSGRACGRTVSRLLLYDPDFPRSVLSSLREMEQCLIAVEGEEGIGRGAIAYLRHLRSSLELAEAQELDFRSGTRTEEQIPWENGEEQRSQWLASLPRRLQSFYGMLHDYYFGHQASIARNHPP